MKKLLLIFAWILSVSLPALAQSTEEPIEGTKGGVTYIIKNITIPGQSTKTDMAVVKSVATGINELTLPAEVTIDGTTYPVTVCSYEESYAPFKGNTELTSVDLSNITFGQPEDGAGIELKQLPSQLFMGCTNLETVVLPATLEILANETFCNCSSLKNVELPKTLTSIGSSAFMNAGDEFTQIVIPAKVTSIGENAFQGNMNGLTKIVIEDDPENPDLQRTYGSNVFAGNKPNLSSIEARPIVPPTIPGDAFDSSVFQKTDNSDNSILIVRKSSMQAYKEATGWSNFFGNNVVAGLGSVSDDATDAPVEYFNLQGIRVAYPAQGQVYIRRQGDTVLKTIFNISN